MTHDELWRARLKQAQLECQRHTQRLLYLQEKMANLFPLDVEKYNYLDEEQIGIIDQVLFRFGKLQDTMGQRIFPAILQVMLEWQDDESFLDRLNRLERLQIIPSAKNWNTFRELRNLLTHEYPEQPERNIVTLNVLWQRLPELLKMWAMIDKIIAKL